MVALTAPRALVSATHAGDHELVAIDDAGHLLRADAAASVERMHAAGLPRGNVTSAYRTAAQQRSETGRAAAGETPSAASVGTSWHEAALAVDWPEPQRSWIHAHGIDYGWVLTLNDPKRRPYEPWHAVYVPDLDQHAHDTGNTTTAEDIMHKTLLVHDHGGRAAWEVIEGLVRRHATADMVAAWKAQGHTVEIVQVTGANGLWKLPITGSSSGDLVRQAGRPEVYMVLGGYLQHVDAALYKSWGSPPVLDYPADDGVFALPKRA